MWAGFLQECKNMPLLKLFCVCVHCWKLKAKSQAVFHAQGLWPLSNMYCWLVCWVAIGQISQYCHKSFISSWGPIHCVKNLLVFFQTYHIHLSVFQGHHLSWPMHLCHSFLISDRLRWHDEIAPNAGPACGLNWATRWKIVCFIFLVLFLALKPHITIQNMRIEQ